MNATHHDTANLQQRIDELEWLNRLSQILSSSLHVDHILNGIVQVCIGFSRANKAAILLLDPTTKETVKTLVHQSDPSLGSIEHTVNEIVAGWIMHNNKPLLADNFIDGVGIKTPLDRFRNYGSVLAVPLMIDGKIIGIINLMNNADAPKFTEDLLRIAKIIADQSARFIYTAKLHEKLFEENKRLKEELQQQYNIHGIIGTSKAMKAVLETIPLIAKSTATVLIYGETGTGKELVARAIHNLSERADQPFVAINCAAIPANLVESELFGHERGAFTGATASSIGKFEFAHKGTFFLDEISEMPLDLQPKLLRLLEERKFFRLGSTVERYVDIRVIAATNKELMQISQEKKFREDLYYRLNVMPLHLPPLRERNEDIPLLAQYFLDQFSHKTKKFSASALETLKTYDWRGNIRELKNIVERTALLIASKVVDVKDLQAMNILGKELISSSSQLETICESLVRSHDGKHDLLEQIEQHIVGSALQQVHGNVSEAARVLGIDRMVLERRRKKYNI